MRIQHNIAALNSHRQLTANNAGVAKNLEKLSSGYRINRAGDDAAGLAISEKMRAQITGLNTASKNAQDGISLVQTAEGALTEVHSMLNRMAELADQSANGTYQDAVDRENIQKELDSLKSEIDRISEGTNFNGIKLLDGSMGGGSAGDEQAVVAAGNLGAFSFSISGADVGTQVEFKTGGGTAADKGVKASFANGKLTLTLGATANGEKITQKDIDKAIQDATLPDSAKGIKVTLKEDIISTGATTAGTALGGKSTIAKASFATSTGAAVTNTSGKSTNVTITSTKAGNTSNKTFTISNAAGGASGKGVEIDADGNISLDLEANKSYTASQVNQMLKDAGVGMKVSYEGAINGDDLLTSGAAGTDVQTLTGGKGASAGGGLRLQIGESSDTFNQLTVAVTSMSTLSLGIDELNVGTQDGARSAIDKIKAAINSVSSTRGDLGAIQNRLEHTINNLGVTAENMSAAESRVRDVDMAQEMMSFTKNNILTQASQSMLAQANQLPQGVLQLLQ